MTSTLSTPCSSFARMRTLVVGLRVQAVPNQFGDPGEATARVGERLKGHRRDLLRLTRQRAPPPRALPDPRSRSDSGSSGTSSASTTRAAGTPASATSARLNSNNDTNRRPSRPRDQVIGPQKLGGGSAEFCCRRPRRTTIGEVSNSGLISLSRSRSQPQIRAGRFLREP